MPYIESTVVRLPDGRLALEVRTQEPFGEVEYFYFGLSPRPQSFRENKEWDVEPSGQVLDAVAVDLEKLSRRKAAG